MIEHQNTAPDEVVARLKGASIAINKVPLSGAVLEQLPGLKLVAVAAASSPSGVCGTRPQADEIKRELAVVPDG